MPQVTLLSDFAAYRYFTYPHLNGFTTRTVDGITRDATVVVGEIDMERSTSTLYQVDLETGAERRLGEFQHQPDEKNVFVWWDVDIAGTTLVSSTSNAVHVVDLTAEIPAPREIWRAPEGRVASAIVSLHPDGTRCLASHYPPGLSYGPTQLIEIDIASGAATEILDSETMLAHFQYCEADPSWIGFSNQSRLAHNFGPYTRAWAYHPDHAPRGQLLWDQQTESGLVPASHEVWAFHEVSCVLVAPRDVAPPTAPATGQAGLWQLWTDGRPARLVQAANDYSHCSISRDGRWAVVDTGPDADRRGRIELVSMNGEQPPLTLAEIGWGSVHPRHGHPNFSPTGRYVAYTDSDPVTDRTRVGLVDLTDLPH